MAGMSEYSRNDANAPICVGMGITDLPECSHTDANSPACVGMGMVDVSEYSRNDANVPVCGSGLPDDAAGAIETIEATRGLWSIRRAADTWPATCGMRRLLSRAFRCDRVFHRRRTVRRAETRVSRPFRPIALRPTLHGTMPMINKKSRKPTNVKAIQRMLGHPSVAMTLDRYADLFSEDLDALISEVAAAVSSSFVDRNECKTR